MGELRVGRDTEELGVESLELVEGGVEGEDLGRADKGWIQDGRDVSMTLDEFRSWEGEDSAEGKGRKGTD
jgi:hypothetical protein